MDAPAVPPCRLPRGLTQSPVLRRWRLAHCVGVGEPAIRGTRGGVASAPLWDTRVYSSRAPYRALGVGREASDRRVALAWSTAWSLTDAARTAKVTLDEAPSGTARRPG